MAARVSITGGASAIKARAGCGGGRFFDGLSRSAEDGIHDGSDVGRPRRGPDGRAARADARVFSHGPAV